MALACTRSNTQTYSLRTRVFIEIRSRRSQLAGTPPGTRRSCPKGAERYRSSRSVPMRLRRQPRGASSTNSTPASLLFLPARLPVLSSLRCTLGFLALLLLRTRALLDGIPCGPERCRLTYEQKDRKRRTAPRPVQVGSKTEEWMPLRAKGRKRGPRGPQQRWRRSGWLK